LVETREAEELHTEHIRNVSVYSLTRVAFWLHVKMISVTNRSYKMTFEDMIDHRSYCNYIHNLRSLEIKAQRRYPLEQLTL